MGPVGSEEDTLDGQMLGELWNFVFDEGGDPAIAVKLIDRVLCIHAGVLHVRDLQVVKQRADPCAAIFDIGKAQARKAREQAVGD